MGASLSENPSLARYHVIVLHLDADVARASYADEGIEDPPHDDLPCDRPCPPASDTVANLRGVMLGWLGETDIPPRAVLCIPSTCTEAWVAVARYGHSDPAVLEDIECNAHIAWYLAQKPARERLVRIRDGRPKKKTGRYQDNADVIREEWPFVEASCSQAREFGDAVRRLGL